MTNRKDWQVGASSVITTKIWGVSDYALKEYKNNAVNNIEISLDKDYFFEFDFINNAEKFKEYADNNGVNIWSLHIPFNMIYHPAVLDEEQSKQFLDTCLKTIDAGIRIGVKTIVIHPSSEPNEPEDREKLMQQSIKILTILSKRCHDNGAVLAVENLPRTCLCNCPSELIRIINEVPYAQICFDTNHSLMQTNAEFLDELIKNGMKGKIRTIHVSDYDFVNERHWLPKEGIVDWQDLLFKLEQLDYNGVFMYEVSKPNDRRFFYTLKELKANFDSLINS